MENGKSLLETLSNQLNQLAPDLQMLYKDLIRGIEMGMEKKVEMVLGKITSHDSYLTPGSSSEAVLVAEILYACLQEGYSSIQDKQIGVYTAVLPVFTGYLSNQAKTPEMAEFPKFLFHAGEQFALAFVDPQSKKPINFDNFFEFHLQNIKDFLASPGFKAWRKQNGTTSYLQSCISRWMIHLGNFTRNRREKAFINLLDLNLLLLKTIPEFLNLFEGMNYVLPAAKKAFHFLYPKGGDAIEKILARAHKTVPPELKTPVSEWGQIYNIGALPDIPGKGEQQESPELTIPYVYRALLVEILGDGHISSDEEWVIKNMRDYLEITSERYNRIYEQVQEGRKLGRIPVIDRDFSARVFLEKILLKTIEDGVVSDDEKAIIGKVAGALLLSKEILAEVFQEAKNIFKAQLASGEKVIGGPTVGAELDKLYEMIRYTAMEERVRSVLMSDRGIRTYQKAGKMLAGLREKAHALGGEVDRLAQWPVVTFFYEPQVYIYPVLMLFVDSLDVHPTRLEFKGGRIDVEILTDVRGKTLEEEWLEDQKILRIFNNGLDVEIPIKAVMVGETLRNFMEGFEETKGKYALMMMQHSRMAPILAIQKTGYLDFSGNLAQGVQLFNEGKYKEASTLLSMIHQGFPEIQDVLYNLGRVYEKWAAENTVDFTLIDQAVDYYRREIDLNPNSDKSMRALGRIFACQKNWNEAISWLNKALECASGSVLTLVELVEAWLKKDPPTPGKGEIPDYVLEFLGEAFFLCPTHPRVASKIEELDKLLGVDLVRKFLGQAVSTLYQ